MAERPDLIRSMQIPPLKIQRYERYLPTAFDESMSLLEKVNKVIYYLWEYSDLTNDMVDKWNEVIEWLLNDGMKETIVDTLEEWYADGRFEDILEELLLHEYARKDWVQSEIEAIKEWIQNKFDETLTRDSFEVTVGPSGDFKLLGEAIKYVENKPVYPEKATIRIQSGFVMREQIVIKNKDLRFLEIKSDKTIDVVLTDVTNTINLGTNHGDKTIPIIYGFDSIMPTLDVKFKFSSGNIGVNNKYICGCILEGSRMTMKTGNGFTHFPLIGLGAYFDSHVVGHGCDFSHVGNRNDLNDNSVKGETYGFGLAISHYSSFVGKACTANRCGGLGFMFFRSSSGYIDQSVAKDCGHHALIVNTSSVCSARKCVFTDTIDDNVVISESSLASLVNADCSRAKTHNGLIIMNGSQAMFEGGKANNNGTNGIEVQWNSHLDGRNCEATDNGGHGFFVRNGSTATFSFAESRRNGSKGVSAQKGALVDLDRAIIKNNVVGVSSLGSTVSTDQTTVSENSRDGIDAWYGGIVQGRKNSIVKNGRYGIKCYDGQITATDSRILESGEDGIHATQGGMVNATNTSVRDSVGRAVNISTATVNIAGGEMINSGMAHTMVKSGGSLNASNATVKGGTTHFNVHTGGQIFAHGTGATTDNVNTTPNTITGEGMILI